MHLPFPILQSQYQNIFFPQFPREQSMSLKGGPGHLADSNSIPQNSPTTYHPIQIAIIRLMSLLLLDEQLVMLIPLVSDR